MAELEKLKSDTGEATNQDIEATQETLGKLGEAEARRKGSEEGGMVAKAVLPENTEAEAKEDEQARSKIENVEAAAEADRRNKKAGQEYEKAIEKRRVEIEAAKPKPTLFSKLFGSKVNPKVPDVPPVSPDITPEDVLREWTERKRIQKISAEAERFREEHAKQRDMEEKKRRNMTPEEKQAEKERIDKKVEEERASGYGNR